MCKVDLALSRLSCTSLAKLNQPSVQRAGQTLGSLEIESELANAQEE